MNKKQRETKMSSLEDAHELIELEELAINQHELLKKANEKIGRFKKLVIWMSGAPYDFKKHPNFMKEITELMDIPSLHRHFDGPQGPKPKGEIR